LDQGLCRFYLMSGQTNIHGQFGPRLRPEFCLTILALNMNMHSGFFVREEVEQKRAFAKYRRTHCVQNTLRFVAVQPPLPVKAARDRSSEIPPAWLNRMAIPLRSGLPPAPATMTTNTRRNDG